VRIDVTQEDIDLGMPGKCGKCPLARAIRRATGSLALVSGEDVYASGFAHLAQLPMEAQKFVKAYDSDQEVHPFSFDLDIPEGGV
jgi:hypothetical protein